MQREASSAGLIDGVTGYLKPGADGVPLRAQKAVIALLQHVVQQSCSRRSASRMIAPFPEAN